MTMWRTKKSLYDWWSTAKNGITHHELFQIQGDRALMRAVQSSAITFVAGFNDALLGPAIRELMLLAEGPLLHPKVVRTPDGAHLDTQLWRCTAWDSLSAVIDQRIVEEEQAEEDAREKIRQRELQKAHDRWKSEVAFLQGILQLPNCLAAPMPAEVAEFLGLCTTSNPQVPTSLLDTLYEQFSA